MGIRQLRTLLAVADAGSFQAAAQLLYLTQSAVSMQMRALEEELGQALFDRRSRPPMLTAVGRRVAERAREIVGAYDALREIADAAGGLSGEVRLGVIPTVATGLLPAVLARLRGRHPGLRVKIESGLSPPLIDRVRSGALDLALVTEAAPLDAGLDGRLVFEEPLVLAAPEGARGRAAALLAERPFIRFNRHAGIGRVIDAALRRRGLAVEEAMELDSVEAILEMVSRGLGVAIVPARSIPRAFSGRVRRVSLGPPPLTRRVTLAARRGQADEPFAAALREALAAALADDGG